MDMRSAAAPNNIKIKLLLFVTTHYKKGAKTKILPLRNTTLRNNFSSNHNIHKS